MKDLYERLADKCYEYSNKGGNFDDFLDELFYILKDMILEQKDKENNGR